MGSVGMPLRGSLMIMTPILAICVPASRLIARWVEGSRFGFTVGGASFAGALATVGVPLAMDVLAPALGFETPFTACLAALSIAYLLGESVGRLACISFGCCFGKPVAQSTGWARRFSKKLHFVFTGRTKKIAFAAGLDEVPVDPVQAMTASLYGALTLCGLWLFFEGRYGWVIPATITTSRAWRVYSEDFRADYRGPGDFTAYQVMAGITAALSAVAPCLLPDPVSPRRRCRKASILCGTLRRYFHSKGYGSQSFFSWAAAPKPDQTCGSMSGLTASEPPEVDLGSVAASRRWRERGSG